MATKQICSKTKVGSSDQHQPVCEEVGNRQTAGNSIDKHLMYITFLILLNTTFCNPWHFPNPINGYAENSLAHLSVWLRCYW
ncbi:Uncharacterized protein APZ42_015971 [Daphnia magna]|uniref:Uncharacterized protein n=1 Tax=Daphnia magna TaxID=35525 RepID=A0A162NGS4_9CRUS|nr:Uncharacterized protein APZ42_015971 [Daphnia magna]